ncbi:hypothetical protein HDU79_008907 [Rhizoclosmatium sp. JEL0117]|nr:hypothetical protein HDU79_008907 [Rhizoclosmatium sp. JEL0117]
MSQSSTIQQLQHQDALDYGTLFDDNQKQGYTEQSSMSDHFEEMLDDMNQRSASPMMHSFCSESGSQNILNILNDPRAMIPLPPHHMPHPVTIETAPPSSDYEEIKAFLRWNSEPEIDGGFESVAENSSNQSATTGPSLDYASSIYTSSGSSNNLMPSPPTTATSPADIAAVPVGLNQNASQIQFSYDPHSLALQPEAYFGFTGYEEPRYSSTALHGFELMTDQAYYGYSNPIATTPNFSSSYYPLSQQQNQQLPLSHHQSQQFNLQNQSNSLKQQQQQQQQNQQSSFTASKAFRWAAAAASANTPTSHISMSMIVPQQPNTQQLQNLDHFSMESATLNTPSTRSGSITSTTTTTTAQNQTTTALHQPTPSSTSQKSKKHSPDSTQPTGPHNLRSSSSTNNSNSSTTNQTQPFSPYKKPMKLSPQNATSKSHASKLLSAATAGTSAGSASKMVKIEHLESQQKWFKEQVEMQSRRGAPEREGMIAALLRIAGGGVAAGKDQGEK